MLNMTVSTKEFYRWQTDKNLLKNTTDQNTKSTQKYSFKSQQLNFYGQPVLPSMLTIFQTSKIVQFNFD